MKKFFRSVTTFLYTSTQIAALVWVTISYVIALYSTVKLQQPFPVEELSGQAISCILGVGAFKTLGNIAEHNDSWLFGTSKRRKAEDSNEEEYT